MSTAAQVRAAWLAAVMGHASVTSITDKIYDYDVTLESTKEFSKLRYDQALNFFLYLVTKANKVLMMGQYQETFTVEIRHVREADVPGANWKLVESAFETITGLVQTGLTGSWSNTVDYYRVQEGPPTIVAQQLEGLPVWSGSYKFFGIKYTG